MTTNDKPSYDSLKKGKPYFNAFNNLNDIAKILDLWFFRKDTTS